MLWVGIPVAGLLVAWIAVWMFARSLPADHEVARTMRLGQKPETVWHTITDFSQVPNWNPNVRQVERLPDLDGCEVWQETHHAWGRLTLMTTESEPLRRLVRVVADEALPFQGSWEYVIESATGGCRVTVTERGEIPGSMARLRFRLSRNPAQGVEDYLQALAARFAEPARIELLGGES